MFKKMGLRDVNEEDILGTWVYKLPRLIEVHMKDHGIYKSSE